MWDLGFRLEQPGQGSYTKALTFCHSLAFAISITLCFTHSAGPILQLLRPRPREDNPTPSIPNLQTRTRVAEFKTPPSELQVTKAPVILRKNPYPFETHAALVRHVRRCVIMTKRHGGLVELPMSIEAESSPTRRLVDLRQYSYKV